MDALPDELLTCIFNYLPIYDLKTVRLCQRRWNRGSSSLLFKKATFCLAQPLDKRNEQLDFLTTPLTCSSTAPGYLVRDLLIHHQHKPGPLNLLSRLNDTMPSIARLKIDKCACYPKLDFWATRRINRVRGIRLQQPSSPERDDPDVDRPIDVNATWQAAMMRWSNLQSIELQGAQLGMTIDWASPVNTLVTHLNLDHDEVRLDANIFSKMPSMFPSLRYLACLVRDESGTNALLDQLRELRAYYEKSEQELVSRGLAWTTLREMKLRLFLNPLDTCYLLLAVAMMARNLANLTLIETRYGHDASDPFPVSPENAGACVLSDGLPPSFKALQSLKIQNVCVNTLMASALFRTTEQLARFDLDWSRAFVFNDNIDEIQAYTPDHALFDGMRTISKPTLREFAFKYHDLIHGCQLLACIIVPAFTDLVKLKIDLIKELCMDMVLEQMPRLEILELRMSSSATDENGTPVVKYPTRRVPHALKNVDIEVSYDQGLVAPKNLDNINPGTIHYRFTEHFAFDWAYKEPNDDDTFFTWLAPDAQKMVMDVNQWREAPGVDMSLSWACFPKCHLAELVLCKPEMKVGDFGHPSLDRDPFGAIVEYQAEPGPDDPKLRIYHLDKDGLAIKSLNHESDLIGFLETLLPVLYIQQKEVRHRRRRNSPYYYEPFEFDFPGPATATLLIVLAKAIDKTNVFMKSQSMPL
ncbi:hypothetical protein BC940DRAFT_301388 [Gongronella butleri]|nr:hypothetical protein BC940DRAFT_301388 [Gongronella butleri]